MTMLKQLGYVNVRTAVNGSQALQSCAETTFDLILMDCQMPEMDGFEATRELRARGVRTPIVAFSASESPTIRSRCLKAGMNDYLSKPAALSVMDDAVKYWLGRELEETGTHNAPVPSNWLSRLLGRADDSRARTATPQPLTTAPPQGTSRLSGASGVASTRRT
jgi:CheY-like chemotaxis protein